MIKFFNMIHLLDVNITYLRNTLEILLESIKIWSNLLM